MLPEPNRVHFIGIAGTVMGALAAAVAQRGWRVTGSDERLYPPMSDFLRARRIEVREGYREENVPADADLIVIGNAIRRGNPEAELALNRRMPYLSLPELLKFFFLRRTHNLVVTGTHGKTTTTALLAHIFERAGLGPSYLIGGIPLDLGQGAALRDSVHFIIEGDEYDTAFFDKRSKFVHYLPELVAINNIEFDHADIFRDLDAIKTSFRHLLNVVPSGGMILLNADDPNCVEVGRHALAPTVGVGFCEDATHRIVDAQLGAAGASFRLFDLGFETRLQGEFNVRNAAMAICAARHYGVPLPEIRRSVASFRGVKRRQELRGVARGVQVFDDFGHHPTAIHQTILALRRTRPGARIWAVFEPRSNTTRRAVFQHRLAEALAAADGAVIARVDRLEQLPPENRLDPERLAADLRAAGRQALHEPDVAAIIERLQGWAGAGDVIVVFSNGGFDNIHERLLARLREQDAP